MPKLRLVAVVTLALGGEVMARTPRFTRPEPTVKVSLSERVRAYLPKATATARPRIEADALLSATWLGAAPRMEQAQLLERLIADTTDPNEKAEYYFRLGELYAIAHRDQRLRASEALTRADQTTEPAAKSKLQAEGNAAAQKAKDFLVKSVKVLRVLTDNDAFRNYPKLDVALFTFGYTLQLGKYMKEARAAYDKLLKNYPNSKFVPEAHLVFGDYYFEAAQLQDAEARYRMVLKFPKSAVYPYATYKLGWIHLQTQRYQEALEAFFEAAQQTKNDAKQAAMHRAAVLDFVRAYAEIGKADKAFPAFSRVDPAAANEMLELLADLYVEQGKLDHAIFVTGELMKGTPQAARVCDWQYRITRSMMSRPGANNAEKAREIENLARLYRELQTRAALPAPALQECRANAMAMTGEIGRAWHDEAMHTRDESTLEYAIRLYDAFVTSFPDDPARAEVQGLRAEALWSLASHTANDRIARDRWSATANAFAELAKATRSAPASDAAILAFVNGLDPAFASTVAPPLTPGAPPPARALTADEQRILDIIPGYASGKVARDPGLGQLRFIEACLYRAANHHDKAGPIFAALFTTHRDAPFGEAAAVMAIDSLILVQKLDAMLLFVDQVAADARYLADKPALAGVIKLVRSRSMRR